jgi:hypothetical protein
MSTPMLSTRPMFIPAGQNPYRETSCNLSLSTVNATNNLDQLWRGQREAANQLGQQNRRATSCRTFAVSRVGEALGGLQVSPPNFAIKALQLAPLNQEQGLRDRGHLFLRCFRVRANCAK